MNILKRPLITGLLAAFLLNVHATVAAITPAGESWKDSYSVGGQCYCASTFDHGIGDVVVDTPAGVMKVREICALIGPGPGSTGNPIYNDIQCGNGPPNDAVDEKVCPGRVDQGSAGCQVIGPTWNLERVLGIEGRHKDIDKNTGVSQTSDNENNEPDRNVKPTNCDRD